jgi:hypothetical protein
VRFARVVDGGLDAQHRDLVVDLDPVARDTVADPPALGSALGVGDHLGGDEARVELSAQEAEHVFGGRVQGRVMDQVGKTARSSERDLNMTSVAISAWSSTQ